MHHRHIVYLSVAALISLSFLLGLQYSDRELLNIQSLKQLIPNWRTSSDEQIRYQPDVDVETSEAEPNDDVETSKTEPVHDEETSETEEVVDDAQETPHRNSTLPRMTLVVATTSGTDNFWVEEQLGDLLGEEANIYATFYVADDENAPFHTPENKGNEAMSYLSYVVDFYDNLPDVSVFIHGHEFAWHNNALLDMSSALIIRHLNREKVIREGYMNLRCHWDPGCPDHVHPQETEYDANKQEEVRIKEAWETLFPLVPVPDVLSQACCAQFAVSKASIQKLPKQKYIDIRDWLLETDIDDYVLGRIFEYLWQYIFNETPIFCPDPRICYCDGYGACFEDPRDYEAYFDGERALDQARAELETWESWGSVMKRLMRRDDIVPGGPNALEEGRAVRVAWLEEQIHWAEDELKHRREKALEYGKNPENRRKALEAMESLDSTVIQ